MSAKFVIAKREAVLKVISAEMPETQDDCGDSLIKMSERRPGLLRQLASVVLRRFAYQH